MDVTPVNYELTFEPDSRNNEYMYSLDISLNDGEIIGFIPPISGG